MGAGQTVIGFFCHHAANQSCEAGRDLAIELFDGRRLFVAMALEFFQGGSARKRRPAGQGEIERTAQGVNIGTRIDLGRILGLLGRDVIHRADNVPLPPDHFAGQPGLAPHDCQAEVQ